MSQFELLRRVVGVLDAADVEYMLTGSHVSSLQGEPRSTHDIDLVVDLPETAVGALLAAFPPPDYYLSEPAIVEAIRNRSMFNLLSVLEGDKVDFWLLTDEPFDRSRFSRKQTTTVRQIALKTSAPEDTILAKLRWSTASGGSEKQFRDALRVYELQYASLDHEYLQKWAAQIGVESLWQRIQNEAELA